MTYVDSLPFAPNSLLFAPLEGITDSLYRTVIMKLYPQWARLSTDFLRLPTSGKYPRNKYIEHLGHSIYQDPELLRKTTFQIMTTAKAKTPSMLETLAELGITHIDLNLGCPSRTVINHGGGSYLLSDLLDLKTVLSTIRSCWSGLFTVKMRIGMCDDSLFDETLTLIEGEGVDAITLHARTRNQFYSGRADWNFITRAVQQVRIPVIGNGDIWTIKDVHDCLRETGCHSVMIGRGALKTPWLPRLTNSHSPDLQERRTELLTYYGTLSEHFHEAGYTGESILKRMKSVSQYTMEDFPDHVFWKNKLLRSRSLAEFFEVLEKVILVSKELAETFD
ncbi:MAG: tRNA-dihydrouridine synthase family protein [Bdellovibrio sp.]|nr:tRNA-dihydrouridine synthase family protein [Bdellovibrio sp.]